ncbi:glycine--tRNA ligase subunit beta [Paenibacillus sp. GCM10027626]|uniref:glycine--tRNA ligase subunit beta n=1 Tax=Paenibacillus sp. GCM10027626 TaxID=3273411 RepID=UPI00363FA149
MSKDLLLEIGLEEVPARFVRGAINQLKEKMTKWLDASRISYGEVSAYATPRRLAVLINSVAEKQADVEEEVKGPSRKIAQDEQGAWSKAALGFARSQGVDPDAFYFKTIGGVDYIYANKSSAGVATTELLAEGLSSLITSMTFPKNMRWGSHELRFVRPVRWLVAMFGEDTVPLEITGVTSGKTSRGHRFLGTETAIAKPADYIERMREQYVIADPLERERLIVEQIEALAAEKGWTIAIKEDLLEEVLFLVEYPSVLFGTFDPAFLHIPQEVLITSMREHQRYFPVLDQAGKLLPYFVTVRNGDRKSIDQVAKGNEKVLRARLSDAKFFYQEDQKLKIEEALAKLTTVVYHEKLGTVADKVKRIEKTAAKISALLQADKQTAADAARTAAICKFDLVTQMVYEFPELQGLMGEDYARKAGEREEVAAAINEHYQPRFAGDQAPASLVGAIVSLADKIDTIVGCFSIGIIPTGSQDPYALRRQAAGIVQIITAHNLQLPLGELFAIALNVHAEANTLQREADEVRKELYEFFALRVKNVLSEQGVRYDVIDAVMAAGFDQLNSTMERAAAVTLHAAGDRRDEFKLVVDALTRVGNLAAKATTSQVDPALFADAAESALFSAWQAVRIDIDEALAAGDASKALAKLALLKTDINRYFDHVMVMAEDEAVRANRLATLALIAEQTGRIADLSKLVW